MSNNNNNNKLINDKIIDNLIEMICLIQREIYIIMLRYNDTYYYVILDY